MNPRHPLLPETFPESWAQSHGQDDYGLWQGVSIRDIEIRFRWIPPGEFLMGSPEDEPERLDCEGPQHSVRFAHGFWLAETACTQALWKAVTGNNPGYFKGDEWPVENTDWNDAKAFIDQVNDIRPGLALRLPSEAEWEYACRAGTTTPFWFGAKLTSDKTNYDGNPRYANSPKGMNLQETAPVKSFRPNPWGLYQMHGNVWEWCEDCWHDDYEGAPDNGGPWVSGGVERSAISRGGSWGEEDRVLRSAFRGHLYFDDFDFLSGEGQDDGLIRSDLHSGFRLARDPELQPSQPAGAEAASRRRKRSR